ncbi:hypothetical protein [Fimbriimonas ginsengisoli]|uniref:Organic solvent tolerance-like N-terminal domain-containing protein n=1 Tax=Fimbriimonas ginsengisoli Gsoil 348 TaxID=661478 RepID=A0A068NNL0_FIMGI|nr:hypothetical protein [Fimbriimonas ginsengisoli]AIE84987.1 hypothetical protein OP10G_1619 [Fimbriimonas ginsengisoli Gsoil 348]
MARPLSPNLRLARNLILLAGLIAVTPATVRYMREFAGSDPLGSLKNQDFVESGTMMRMQGVQIKHFDKNGLVTYAKCDHVDLAADRHTFELSGIRDAVYRGKEGTFQYTAHHAKFIDVLKQLKADGGVRVRNKELDLSSNAFEYNGLVSSLLVRGDVSGKLKGGAIRAKNIDYRIDSEAFTAGPVYWKGALALDLQGQEDQSKPRTWEIQGQTISYSGKNQQIATYTNAIAADDEVILIAPKVVHDRKTDVLTATGRVQYFSAKADLVADQCVVYRKEKRIEMIGNVLMYVKPKKDQDGKPKVEPLPAFQPLNPDQVKPEPPKKKPTEAEKKQIEQVRDTKTIRDFPTVMVSAKIEYWYGKGARRAVITGSPQGRQELPEGRWRHLWTNVAYYDGEKELLKMVSTKALKDTRMKDSVGDNVSSDWMEVSTVEDDDSFTGSGFVGTFTTFDDETKDGGTTPPPTDPPKKVDPPKTGGGDPKKTGGGKVR